MYAAVIFLNRAKKDEPFLADGLRIRIPGAHPSVPQAFFLTLPLDWFESRPVGHSVQYTEPSNWHSSLVAFLLVHTSEQHQTGNWRHGLEQAPVIPVPNPYSYQFWQPWVKNYRGEGSVDYSMGNVWATWVWLDQYLKESTTGRR